MTACGTSKLFGTARGNAGHNFAENQQEYRDDNSPEQKRWSDLNGEKNNALHRIGYVGNRSGKSCGEPLDEAFWGADRLVVFADLL